MIKHYQSFSKIFTANFLCLFLAAFVSGSVYSQAPVVTSFSPVSAAKYQGVYITGTNLTGTTAVKFGGVAANYFFVISSTTVFASVGDGASGDVTVTNPSGTSSLAGFIFIPPPVIQSFSPAVGKLNTSVTIRGSRFTGATAVYFGNTLAMSFNALSDTVITAVVGAGGSGNVAVTGPGGTGFLPGFTHLGPVIKSYTPALAVPGSTITIKGANFLNTTSVRFGNIPASSFVVNSDSVITAVTASGSAGVISVVSPNGTGYAAGFNLPRISTFTPTSGSDSTVVNIKGKSFTGVNSVSFGGIAARSFTTPSDTLIVAIVGTGATGQLKVGNSYGADSSGYFFYNYLPPVITSFTPTSAIEGDTVTIHGKRLTSTRAVYFGNIQAKSHSVISDTLITAVVGGGASGSVSLSTPGGNAQLPGFVFNGPSISSFSPTGASKGDTVLINGTNLSNASAVSFGGTPALFFTVVSPMLIKAVVGNGSTGEVVVVTPLGTAKRFGFYMKPVIRSFSPIASGAGGTVVIKGMYLSGVYAVSFGGVMADSFSVTSDTTITAVIASGTSGAISVTSGGGTASLAGFTFILAPRVNQTGPSYGGTGTTVYVTGLYFTGASSVKIGGVEAASFTIVDDSHITAVVAGGATGSITVTTPGGSSSNGRFVYFEKPVITSFSPTVAGPATEVIIRGKNLRGYVYSGDGYTEYLTAKFGNQKALRAGSTSDTTIVARVSTGASGYVYVETPGGKDSMAGFIFKPVPAITSFSPAAGVIGTTVTIKGYNFSNVANNNAVFFGGVRATVSSSTATGITVKVPAGATFDPISVTVNNLAGYSKKPFIVTYPGATNFSNHSLSERIDIPVGFKPKALLGDVNADGKLDLVVGNSDNNSVEILVNKSSIDSIWFAPKVTVAACTQPNIQAVKDFDGDGRLDILVVTGDVGRPYLMLNNGAPGSVSFAPPILLHQFIYGFNSMVGDFNNDGRPDITTRSQYFTRTGSEFINFHLNDFCDTVQKFSQQNTVNVSNGVVDQNSSGAAGVVSPVDLDGDGKLDFVVGMSLFSPYYYQRYFTILKNNAPAPVDYLSLTKTIINTTGSPYNPQAGDLNGDSLPDIICDTVAFINTGNFTFSRQKNTCVDCSFVDDMDGDGKTDLMSFARDSISIARNQTTNGVVSLTPKISFYTGAHTTYYTIGDLNGDGKPDVVASRYNDNTISVLRNKVGEILTLCPGGSTSIVSNLSGTSYQWQQNNGTGFVNISDNATFSGTRTQTLSLNQVSNSFYGYKYRCLVNGQPSYVYSLRFETSWTGMLNSVWEQSGNWACSTLPDANTDVVINSGNVIISSNAICRSITLTGDATLTIQPGYKLMVVK